jgi:tryptophan synthase beta chain
VTEATTLSDIEGHFGPCGGRFVSETLFAALDELRDTSELLSQSLELQADFDLDMGHYEGRPSPLYHAKRLSDTYGGARIYLKREDLNLWTPLFNKFNTSICDQRLRWEKL